MNVYTREEERFLEFWKEQREGSLVKYYLLFTFARGLLYSALLMFGSILTARVSVVPLAKDNYKIAIILCIGFSIALVTAIVVRTRNERRYKRLIERKPADTDATS